MLTATADTLFLLGDYIFLIAVCHIDGNPIIITPDCFTYMFDLVNQRSIYIKLYHIKSKKMRPLTKNKTLFSRINIKPIRSRI